MRSSRRRTRRTTSSTRRGGSSSHRGSRARRAWATSRSPWRSRSTRSTRSRRAADEVDRHARDRDRARGRAPGRGPHAGELRRPAPLGAGARRLRRRPEALGGEDPRGDPGRVDRGGRLSAEPIRVDFGRLRYFIAMAFECVGMPAPDAQVVASLMAEADLRGADGHGVIRLVPYLKRIRAGGVNLHPDIRVVKERAAMALVHGDNGMGHLVMKRAAEIAVEKARTAGVAWVGAQWSNHAGPAALYARMMLPHDMLGLYFAVGNANHLPPWGGVEMLLSTNPIAAAIPAGEEPPIVLDMATTVAAYGKVKAKAARGEMMPEGWMIDRSGKPLTDPKRAEEGMLLPLGGMEAGYKGYGLAMIIGLLAGTLGGAAMGKDVIDFNHDDDSVTNTGQAICAINVAAFGDVATFKAAVDTLVRDFRGSERIPGVDRISVPGERSAETRVVRGRDGIPIAPALMLSLDQLAGELGIAKLR